MRYIFPSSQKGMYADYAATTPLLPEAREAMLPWLDASNPSSLHAQGRKAKLAIDESREIVSHSLGCLFGEICFTSSGTEAANLAIIGAALGTKNPERKRILFSSAEHHCVLHTQSQLQKLGFTVEHIPVNRNAQVIAESINLDSTVLLVAAMHANNELGTLNQTNEIARKCREHGVLFFCDAVQTYLGEEKPDADLISIAAHKVYGPKGAGALYVRAGTQLNSVTVGGGQEREMRAGTENVAAIVGFAAAVKHHPPFDYERKQLAAQALKEYLPSNAVQTVEEGITKLPGHVHIRIPGHPAEQILIALDRLGISASSGAACSSGSVEPSHVLLACGYDKVQAAEGLRFSFGAQSTPEEARQIAQALTVIAST